MGQLKQLSERLTGKQKISLLVAAVLVLGGLYALANWNKERDFQPLYRGLAAEDAGSILAKLKETGVEYRVTDGGGTILVPSARVAEVRLQVAAAGLPKTGRMGFELFDGANFGTTDFGEQVNFRRAVEGELERSVRSISEVESARVHVTFPKQSVFLESRQPAKASVLVKLRPGAKLGAGNVVAIRHLVASAVEGLQPEAVSVLDMNGNLLSKPQRPLSGEGGEASDAGIEYRQSVEKDLLAKIHSTLEPLVGPDRYRAGASVECDFSSGETSEESYDPARSVMTNSQKTEESSGAALAAGVPGTASNLPRPAVRPMGAATGSAVLRRTENIAYQSSRLVKRMRLPQGGIKRISIAVLVDHDMRWEKSGKETKRVVTAPPPERLKVIRDVLSGVVGLQPDRGDSILVETLPFESTLHAPPPEAAPAAPVTNAVPLPPWLEKALKQTPLPILLGVAGATLVVLLGGVAYLLLRSRKPRKSRKDGGKSLEPGKAAAAELEGAENEFGQQIEATLARQRALQEKQEQEILASLSTSKPMTMKSEVLKKHIGEQAKKDRTAMAHVVRTWLAEGEER
ncbi:MAG: flagellar basal-body MS-ring/collar protein FliF [Bryobacteraceae bacterium]|nr:flagellar basal-body MS-ring/collar protein FliF [Bryobacteraceae bacterium]